MTVSNTLDRIPEQGSQLRAISQISNSCQIIITMLMPQYNDEHGGGKRNFLQVVSSRMAAVSSTALELLSKSGRWIVLVLPSFFHVLSPSAFFRTV
ncbi:hypothetical protein T07_13566 [Trichinella nelsoni]|uniref:Uncharacterized protein n=1 Tax=Trichinella nelsoni TaxID=6336 RepID=A0A0V0RUH1_9BILA|nr:hypothetical protein T07_13566 [Trichinella nelsoni]